MTNNKSAEAAEQHAQIGVLDQTDSREHHTRRPDAQWFGSAGLGVFVHWGIASVNGDGDLSWSMMRRVSGQQAQNEERYGPFAVQILGQLARKYS